MAEKFTLPAPDSSTLTSVARGKNLGWRLEELQNASPLGQHVGFRLLTKELGDNPVLNKAIKQANLPPLSPEEQTFVENTADKITGWVVEGEAAFIATRNNVSTVAP